MSEQYDPEELMEELRVAVNIRNQAALTLLQSWSPEKRGVLGNYLGIKPGKRLSTPDATGAVVTTSESKSAVRPPVPRRADYTPQPTLTFTHRPGPTRKWAYDLLRMNEIDTAPDLYRAEFRMTDNTDGVKNVVHPDVLGAVGYSEAGWTNQRNLTVNTMLEYVKQFRVVWC